MLSLPTSGFKWISPKILSLDKYVDHSLRGCVLEVDLEYPKKLHEMRYDYRLALDKLETKKEIMSDFQLIFSFFLGFPS